MDSPDTGIHLGCQCQNLPTQSQLRITDLPPEIHHYIVDFLDRIDSTCFGLTNRHFFAIHQRRHGSVPLSTGRDKLNDIEWVWGLATATIDKESGLTSFEADNRANVDQKSASAGEPTTPNKPYCRICNFLRCELHRHLNEWIPRNLEYCSVSQRLGPPALKDAADYCHRRSPRDPRRCGRHHPRVPAETSTCQLMATKDG
ncbi:putative F-box domain-containing protein [Colletotrichum truncatum]|uniref:F-box domain-containing protein n=1 Tax=Colletotrichum truncatum TaxID=5467 RepID=A0ACC3YH87_COLTU|nr:putative F-box domain-containing protein [Colletotrichum truncatum]KAF6792749.1 putative F-box domain-containing protein [Colletotrichum truncatum]